MKRFLKFTLLILVVISTMMITTFLLDIPFIQKYVVRQFIVYLLIIIELIVGLRTFTVMLKHS